MAAAALASVIEGRGKYLRPTSVRERVVGGQNIAIEVLGLREAELIPGELRTTYEVMLERLRRSLETEARAAVPGGASGKLGRQVHALRVGPNRIVVGTAGSQFARALNRGFTSTPKTKRALRFNEEGNVVFTMRTRVAGRHFFEKWIAISGPLTEAIYESSFYNIRDMM